MLEEDGMAQTGVHISWGNIVGGTILLLLGIYLAMYQVLTQAVGDPIGQAIVAHGEPQLINWIRLLGLLMVARGVYALGTSIIPPGTLTGRLANLGGEVFSVLSIPLLLWLREHVGLIPVVSFMGGETQVTAIPESVAQIVRLALNVVIALVVLGIVIAVIRLLVSLGASQDRAASG
jgi:hypothetical protein